MNLMLGLITPPVGLNMYIVSSITGISSPTFLRANAPFFLILVAVLGLITFWPPLSLFLPSLFFRWAAAGGYDCREVTDSGVRVALGSTRQAASDARRPGVLTAVAPRPDRP
jgi:hypothetical protein